MELAVKRTKYTPEFRDGAARLVVELPEEEPGLPRGRPGLGLQDALDERRHQDPRGRRPPRLTRGLPCADPRTSPPSPSSRDG